MAEELTVAPRACSAKAISAAQPLHGSVPWHEILALNSELAEGSLGLRSATRADPVG